MAFFDQLGKQISGAGKNVAQQTRKLADSTLLQNSISEKQKAAQQLYATLGRIYYEAYKDDPTVSGSETILQLKTLLSEISQCQEKLAHLRGNNICPQCGAVIAGDSLFCRGCGAQVATSAPPPAAPATNLCPHCGAEMAADYLFCIKCGAKIDTPQQSQVPQDTQAAPAANLCPQCGAEMPADYLFCTKCGNHLG